MATCPDAAGAVSGRLAWAHGGELVGSVGAAPLVLLLPPHQLLQLCGGRPREVPKRPPQVPLERGIVRIQ